MQQISHSQPSCSTSKGPYSKGWGDLNQSVEAYNKALAIKPDYAEAYYNMGVTLKDQGKLEEAIEAYNKALLIKPDYAEPTTTWAMLSKIKASWKRR